MWKGSCTLFIWFLFFLPLANGQEVTRFDSLINLADSLVTEAPDSSLVYATEALKLAEESADEKWEVFAYISLARIYSNKTELRKSVDYANRAIPLALELNLSNAYVDALLISAGNFRIIGEFDKSSELLFEAMRITEQSDDKLRTGKALSAIGFNYFDLGNYEKALEYYGKSFEIAKELNDSEGIARDLNNLAATYASMGVMTDFERNVREAISINKRYDNKFWLGVNYSNLGSYYSRNDLNDSAFYYFNLSKGLYQEINHLEKLSKVNLELAELYEANGNNESRLSHLESAFNLATENGFLRMQYLSSQDLHNYYLEQTDTSTAYHYSRIEGQARDSLEIANNNTRLNHLELLYDIEKKELERAAREQRQRFTTRLIIVSLIAGLLLIVMLLLRYRLKVKYTRLKQAKLSDELDFKKREMTSNALNLMRKNEVLVEIAAKLKEVLRTAVKDETKHSIRRLTDKLEQATESDTWNDFEKRFNEVHQDFYYRLEQRFPNLSPNDKRLAAFLKLNMSSKDISALTGQKVESLEKARTRLRKKIGITNTSISLVSFLSQV